MKTRMMKKITKKITKIIPIICSIVLSINSAVIPVFASEEKDTGTKKEEVVYINLDTNGSLEKTYVVNSFAGGKITDYGMYSTVKVLNTTDKIHQQGDKITLNSSADKVYYKGELDGKQIPWNISIRYFLDNQEYKEENLLGKSGALKIKLNITKNKACYGKFFDNYALQTNVTLDTEKYKNIKAKDATIANVGGDKQLTFTSLPGKGLKTEITANVKNFEMKAISINGIKMNLNVDIDDKDLMDEVNELVDAIDKLDSGATKIDGGTNELETGGTKLEDGASALDSGVDSLDSGIKSLNKGINEMQKGLDELDKKSSDLTDGSKKIKEALTQLKKALESVSTSAEDIEALVTASSDIKKGIDDLADGSKNLKDSLSYQAFAATLKENGLDLTEVKDGNTEAIKSLQGMLTQVDNVEKLLESSNISEEQIEPVKTQCVELANTLVTLLQGNNAALGGMETYLDGVSGGASDLADGAKELQTQYKKFDTAIGDLATLLIDMLPQMTSLKEGVDTIVEEYGKFDDGVNAYTGGVNSAANGNKKLVDGGSELASGSSKLKKGSKKVYDGTVQLVSGIMKLYRATNKLEDGTGEMKKETSGMDKKVEDKIDDMLKTISGNGDDIESFVSKKNTKVQSVQFVIQTKEIKQKDAKVVEKKEEKKSFWDKLGDLF